MSKATSRKSCYIVGQNSLEYFYGSLLSAGSTSKGTDDKIPVSLLIFPFINVDGVKKMDVDE